jgi:hypothetical protein
LPLELLWYSPGLKDPLALDFPLALSYEPRLLPLAVANGFKIDVKVRPTQDSFYAETNYIFHLSSRPLQVSRFYLPKSVREARGRPRGAG